MKNGPYDLILAPESYPGKLYRGRYCYKHTFVYWKNTGILPSAGQVIHHKNGKKRDNRFSNLELVNGPEHSAEHRLNFFSFLCDHCRALSMVVRSSLVSKIKAGRRYFFCSRSCGSLAYRARTKNV